MRKREGNLLEIELYLGLLYGGGGELRFRVSQGNFWRKNGGTGS
jgi:hypothetical protein